MRTQGISAALLITAALVLAGCSAEPAPTVEASAPAPTPSPTASATVDPAVVVAAPAFGGDCAAGISDDQLVEIFGEGAVLQSGDSATTVPELAEEAGRVAGVLSCVWVDATDRFVASAVMSPLASIAPEVVAGAQPATCVPDGTGGSFCAVSMAVGDAWLSLETATEEQLDKTLPVLGDALVSEQPEPATRPADTWAAPACSRLAAAAQTAFPADTVTEGYPSDDNPTGAYVDALAAYGSMTYCGLNGIGDEAARVFVFAGLDTAALALPLPEIEIAGADAAYGEDTGPQVAVVGSNVIVASEASAATDRALLAALIPAQTPRPADDTDEESE